MTNVRITVAGLEVDFAPGTGVTALFEPSGVHKTLLLEAIAGFVRPDAGRILLEDTILFDAAARVHLPPQRRRCAFVPAAPSLFPHMSPRQNLAFAAKRWPRLERHRRVAETIDKLQLTDDSPALHWTLARALIAEPKLLLIDDPGFDETLLHRVRELAAAPILFASRNLDLCCSAAELLVLDGGRILQRGAPRQVIDHPQSVEIARLVGIPNLFQATVGTLDPGRDRSVLDFEHFSLGGPYFGGHFRGDRVWVAAAAENLIAHPGDIAPRANSVAVELVRAVPRGHSVLLEFAHDIYVSVSPDEFDRQKDNKEWRVEFPPQSLRIL